MFRKGVLSALAVCYIVVLLLPLNASADVAEGVGRVPIISPDGTRFALYDDYDHTHDIYNTTTVEVVEDGISGMPDLIMADSESWVSWHGNRLRIELASGYSYSYTKGDLYELLGVEITNIGPVTETYDGNLLMHFSHYENDVFTPYFFMFETAYRNFKRVTASDIEPRIIGQLYPDGFLFVQNTVSPINSSVFNTPITTQNSAYGFRIAGSELYYSSMSTEAQTYTIYRHDMVLHYSEYIATLFPADADEGFSISEDGRYLGYLREEVDKETAVVLDLVSGNELIVKSYDRPEDTEYPSFVTLIVVAGLVLWIVGMVGFLGYQSWKEKDEERNLQDDGF